MRTPRRALRAASTALIAPLLLLGGPARADGSSTTVGGDLLATRGFVVGAGAPALPATTAAGWLVADLDTGDVLAAKDPHGKYLPASTLKALTAVTLLPQLDPNQLVRPTFEDVNIEGSKVGIVQTVSYPVAELMTAMLVVSGNDAANALATAHGGSAKTVADMNAEALRLHALDTHAVTVNGLDGPGQSTSPYDLALIARAGLQIPAFRTIVSTKRSSIAGPGGKRIAIGSHNRLLWNYDGAIGVKNGFTVKARATFVGAATRGGHTLVVSLLKTNPRYWPEAAGLLDWGFRAVAAGAQPVGELVAPDEPQVTAAQAPQTATVRTTAAKVAAPKRDGLPLLPLGVLGAGTAALGAGLLRNRRRPRSKYRLDLPL